MRGIVYLQLAAKPSIPSDAQHRLRRCPSQIEGPGEHFPGPLFVAHPMVFIGMRLDPAYRPISAEQFLVMDFGTDHRFELVDGVIQMMTGGSSTHARVAGNIYFALRLKLAGGPCQPFNSDMGLRIDDTNVRYPDVAVYCGNRWDFTHDAALAFDDPRAIFEVLSPSTTTFDQGTKLEEYKRLESVDTIVFVDPVNELTRTYQRMTAIMWHDSSFAQPHDVALPSLDVVLTHGEIFARR